MVSSGDQESGFRPLGPPRCETLRYYLTPVGHPKPLWELRRLESNPLRFEDGTIGQTRISAAELCALVGGFLRFLLVANWAQAKAALATKWYR